MNEIIENIIFRLESQSKETETLLRCALWEVYDQEEYHQEFKAEAEMLIGRFAPNEKAKVQLMRLFVDSGYARS